LCGDSASLVTLAKSRVTHDLTIDERREFLHQP
jgi:hypothetical protein